MEDKLNDNKEDELESEAKIVHYEQELRSDEKPNIKEELSIMYNLTKIDLELAEIDDTKGDLPDKIEIQTAKLEEIKKIRDSISGEVELLVNEQAKLITENKKNEAKISKYDEQKYSAKSNKDYDKIMKTIDANFEIIEKSEKRINEIEVLVEELKTKKKDLTKEAEMLEAELIENKDTLDDLNEEYSEEEVKYLGQKKELLNKLEELYRKGYQRLNKMYKGEALAVVRNGNCMGCFNSIPPQTVLEIKAANRIFNCQSCGRILIDESMVIN